MNSRLREELEALGDSHPDDPAFNGALEFTKRATTVHMLSGVTEVGEETKLELQVIGWDVILALKAGLATGTEVDKSQRDFLDGEGLDFIMETVVCALADPALRAGVGVRAES